MKRANKAFIEKLARDNRFLLLLNLCIVCFICGSELGKFPPKSLGLFEYITLILTNHYYILYCMLPIILLIFAKQIKGIQDIERIRYKNALCQIKEISKKSLMGISIYLLLHFVLTLIIGLGKFPSFKDRLIISSGEDRELLVVLNKYKLLFGNAGLALFAILAYMLVGFVVLNMAMTAINVKYGYKKTIAFAILVYLFTFIGFKTDLKFTLPILCFNNYIILHHVLFVNHGLNLILVILVEIFTICLIFKPKIKSHKSGFGELILSRREILISGIIPLFMMAIELLKGLQIENFSPRDLVSTIFMGTSRSNASFISRLGLTILYLTPIFFIGISADRLKSYGQSPVLIRFKSKGDFIRKTEKRYILFLISYLVLLVLLGNIFLHIPLKDNSPKNSILYEIYGEEFSGKTFNTYMIFFGMYLFFDFICFRIIGKLGGSILGLGLIFLVKFILYSLPGLNILGLNFGIINMYEDLPSKRELVTRIIIFICGILFYWILLKGGRKKDAYN